MLMHWMTLRACMHSVVSILCMNIVCKTYMRDEAHWWCAHPQSWVITSRAQRTGRAENAEDGLWCERKDGLDKEKRKREREQIRQIKANKKKKHSHSPPFQTSQGWTASEYMCRGAKVSVSVDFSSAKWGVTLCTARVPPQVHPVNHLGLTEHTQSVTSRSSYTLCLCVHMWAGMNVLNYECVCVCVCDQRDHNTVHSHTGADDSWCWSKLKWNRVKITPSCEEQKAPRTMNVIPVMLQRNWLK